MSWRSSLSRRLFEIRFVFSSTAPEAAGISEFASHPKKFYTNLKTLNPYLPILFRNGKDVPSTEMVLTFAHGKQERVNVAGMTAGQIESALQETVSFNKTSEIPKSTFRDIIPGPKVVSQSPSIDEDGWWKQK